MDGLNFKISGDILRDRFTIDKYGSFIPKPEHLPMDVAAEKFRKQLNAKTGFSRRLADIYHRADVQAANNPVGNTPVLGVGFKLFGQRPILNKRGKTLDEVEGSSQKQDEQLRRRALKIEAKQRELMDLHTSLKPDESDRAKTLIWLIEKEQMMTGGGFDNNVTGQVHKAAMHFISDSEEPIEYEDSVNSELFVRGALQVRDLLISYGLKPGSIRPVGATYVRAMQDNDGMFGYPVYASGYDEWSNDLAVRMLIDSGVDTRGLVGTQVYDNTKKLSRPFAVVDAMAYILDNKVFVPDDLFSLVTLLVRIQKHGWKEADGKLIAKDGKTRAVYPNSVLAAVVEGMIVQPFNEELQRLKVPIMPSLQDKPTRVEMIKLQVLQALEKGYDYLAADWSKWDASVKGSMLATMLQLVVKPFIHADYYYWIDAATLILTYKALILSDNFCQLNGDEFVLAKKAGSWKDVGHYWLAGITNGLISGAKFTHTGGSLYGEVLIHYAIPYKLGWDPIPGAQAGDDTLVGVPLDRIDLTSAVKTYEPIVDAGTSFGLHANAAKMIFVVIDGEVCKVFLQEDYHAATSVWGVGSIFRPAAAIWFSERSKNLSVAEQLMAEISRMNQGADNPYASEAVAWWLTNERYLGWLFKTYGVSGFTHLIESIGDDIESIAKRIDVGSFSFGISRDDLKAGNLPILSVMADVAAKLSFSGEDKASFLGDLNPGPKDNGDDLQIADLTD